MFTKQTHLESIYSTGAFLILRLTSEEETYQVAKAAIAGGMRALEVTYSTPGCLNLVSRLTKEHPDVLIGVGTVMDAPSAFAAYQAGARLIVSPHLKPELITVGNRYQCVVAAGAFSPSEMVASPAQLARQGEPKRPEDLMNMDVLALSGPKGMARFTLHGPQGEEADIRLRARYMADDFDCLQRACVAGVGLCSMPDYLCEPGVRSGELVRVLHDWQLAPGILHAVFPSRRGMVPAVRALLDHLANVRLPATGEA